MRPIDADALKPDYIIPSSSTNTLCTRLVSLQQILIAPTIDAVPVVRCKECKHRSSNNDNDWFETLVCPCECGEYSWNPPDDFFCAYGERRENE